MRTADHVPNRQSVAPLEPTAHDAALLLLLAEYHESGNIAATSAGTLHTDRSHPAESGDLFDALEPRHLGLAVGRG